MKGLLLMCIGCASLMAQSEDLRLTVGKSVVIDYPTDIGRISTSSPDVVDAVAVTTREILLHAKGLGAATLVVWSKSGQRSFYNLSVEQNLEPLRRLIRETFPNEQIKVQAARESVTLTGKVSTKETSDRAGQLAAQLSKTVVNNIQIAQPPAERQVVLKVKFAEVNRNVGSTFGVNLLSTGALNTAGQTTTGQFGPALPGTSSYQKPPEGKVEGTVPAEKTFLTSWSLSDALNIFAFRADINLGALVKALQQQGVLQILAEPNLVTSNGREASFLVGGEFPIPILQGGSNSGAVTVQFREFGIRLTFLPVLTENKTVKLYVKPEVSTIDLSNAVTLSGFLIPALATRRMETNIELGEGQSFVIAGLVDDRVTDSLAKIPGLSNIPILGALFKSREEKKSKTELVVMVTPEIAHPLQPGEKALPVMPREPLPPTQPPVQRGANKPGKGGEPKPVQTALKRK